MPPAKVSKRHYRRPHAEIDHQTAWEETKAEWDAERRQDNPFVRLERPRTDLTRRRY